MKGKGQMAPGQNNSNAIARSASSLSALEEPPLSFNYDSVRRAPVASAPCPHIVVQDFLSPVVLKRVLALLPEISTGGSFPRSALSLPVEILDFLEEFEGPALKALISEKFGLEALEANPSMITMRGQTRAKDGRIHLDSASKRVTLLLYLNPLEQEWPEHAGCLRFLYGPEDLEDYAAEVVPRGGTLVVFPNHPQSWHGHLTYVGPRITVQLNYMHTDSKVKSEQFRHRVSAFMKKIPFLG